MRTGSLFRLLAPVTAFSVFGCGGGELVLPAGEAVRIAAVHGNGQTGSPGQELAESLVVRLLDQEGNGVPNGTVTWGVTNGGGSIGPATTTTDENGLTWSRWTLGPASGPNTADATVAGVG